MNSLSRYEQLLRMCSLIEILSNARRPLSTAELNDGLVERGAGDGLSDRTVRRDLGFLESFGGVTLRTAEAVATVASGCWTARQPGVASRLRRCRFRRSSPCS